MTESCVISSKTLRPSHHRHQFLCYTQWLKALSIHPLQSIAADRANHPSCLYIQLLWSKGDVTWHLVRHLSKFQKSDVKIPVLRPLVAEVERAFEFGSQSDPSHVMCQGPLASNSLIYGSSSDCVSSGLRYYSQLLISRCEFILLLMPVLHPFPPSWEWIFIHCRLLQVPP